LSNHNQFLVPEERIELLTAVGIVVVVGMIPRHEHTELNCLVNSDWLTLLGCLRSAQPGQWRGTVSGIYDGKTVNFPSVPVWTKLLTAVGVGMGVGVGEGL
jgi:threonine dehydrogenase-like Zn-dependent dehydrogenase